MIRDQIKEFLPPVLLSAVAAMLGRRIKYSGDYTSWAEATSKTSGYDNNRILEQTQKATLKVLAGEAAYERDGVVFHTPAYDWPLLTSLLWIANRENKKLQVLDFGGSLGNSYLQHKIMLADTDLHWSIVEQAHFVEAGLRLFNDDRVGFFPSIQHCFETKPQQTIVLGSVLQYLEMPHQLLTEFDKSDARYLIINRTPFSDLSEDKILIQQVPASINAASYPL